ncbi:MAG: hypothetical protein K6C36_06785, partial [Clostridia bacterium]|nr:hypothetical protein [Clostridia bacterium]
MRKFTAKEFRRSAVACGCVAFAMLFSACTKIPGPPLTEPQSADAPDQATVTTAAYATAEPGNPQGPEFETSIVYYSVPISGAGEVYTANEQVRLLLGNHYYLDMVMTGKDGTVNAMKIAVDGGSMYMQTNISG